MPRLFLPPSLPQASRVPRRSSSVREELREAVLSFRPPAPCLLRWSVLPQWCSAEFRLWDLLHSPHFVFGATLAELQTNVKHANWENENIKSGSNWYKPSSEREKQYLK